MDGNCSLILAPDVAAPPCPKQSSRLSQKINASFIVTVEFDVAQISQKRVSRRNSCWVYPSNSNNEAVYLSPYIFYSGKGLQLNILLTQQKMGGCRGSHDEELYADNE